MKKAIKKGQLVGWGMILMAIVSCQFDRQDHAVEDDPSINEFQVIGSHNSYKQGIEPPLLALMQEQMSKSFEELQYEHPTINEQLERYGLRNLEIDVVYDPKGGLYSKPIGLEILKKNGIDTAPYNEHAEMDLPGFKVLHVPDIDFRTSCSTLISCLEEIKQWSEKNPDHFPISITMNCKTSGVNMPGFTSPLPMDPAAFDQLEQEILSVFSQEDIIRPDDVRGQYESLEEAVLAYQWPSIEKAKGKVLFVLDERGQKMKDYVQGHPSLKNRLMFVSASPGQPDAAFLIINNPLRSKKDIQELVRKGYMVRTRADADTREARAGDLSRFHEALASGAQYISTDYYWKAPTLSTDYLVQLPDNRIVRANPLFVNLETPE